MAGALLLVPVAHTATAGILVFAFGGLACSGFFPMTVGYGEATFPTFVELAAGWLIAAYQVGYGVAAFGGGVLQSQVALASHLPSRGRPRRRHGPARRGHRPPPASRRPSVARRRRQPR